MIQGLYNSSGEPQPEGVQAALNWFEVCTYIHSYVSGDEVLTYRTGTYINLERVEGACESERSAF